MKKIMFNDNYGLTFAVKIRNKWKTRRICREQQWSFSDLINANENKHFIFERPKYQIGEVVAVAQSYNDILKECDYIKYYGRYKFGDELLTKDELKGGWNNKMFVRADLMPLRIRITDIKVERLQDISDEDCMAEGVRNILDCNNLYGVIKYHKSGEITFLTGKTPREVYSTLIDKISGRGTWQRNPFVFAYDFELIK